MKLTTKYDNNPFIYARAANDKYNSIISALLEASDEDAVASVMEDWKEEIEVFEGMKKTYDTFDYHSDIMEKRDRRIFEINLEKEFTPCV